MADIRTITLKANAIVTVERDTHQLGIAGMSFVLFKPYLATRHQVETIEEGERLRIKIKDIGGAHRSDLIFIWDAYILDDTINTMLIEVGIDDSIDDVGAEPTAEDNDAFVEVIDRILDAKLNTIFGTP